MSVCDLGDRPLRCTPLHSQPGDEPGFYALFYRASVELRKRSQLITTHVLLPAIELLGRSFRRPVRIGNQHYRLLEIRQHRPGKQQPTRVRLLKL
jgi:hypothetical protein